jgi:hypothetical protein
MLQPQLQSATHEIEHKRPIRIAVAISSYDCQSGPGCAKLIENDLRANITQVPYFVSVFSEFIHLLRQTVVRVGQHKNAPHVPVSMFSSGHSSFKFRCYLRVKRTRASTSAIVDETHLERDARLVPQTRDNSSAWR